MTAKIYVMATPIGNLEDLSLRAMRLLKEADIVAAEDTRRARQLLNHCGIEKKELVSYFDQVEEVRSKKLVDRLVQDDATLVLISDAGTPCISDPGYRLIKLAHEKGIAVHPVPGPSAPTALVSCSGLPSDRVLFLGFLPTKSKALRDELQSWALFKSSIVFFESARRLEKCLQVIAEFYPTSDIVIGRELTKMYEQIITGQIEDVILQLQNHSHLKGEVVVMIHPTPPEPKALSTQEIDELLKADLESGKRFKEILQLRQDLGLNRSELYQKLIQLKGEI